MDAIIDDESMVTGYVYGLFATDRPMLLWECRYIGKTRQTLRQRLNNHKCAAKKRDVYRDRWIRSVWERGADVVIVPFEQYTASKSEVADTLNIREIVWIASGRYQGWDLTNATDGGDGGHGHFVSPEARAKIGDAHRGKTISAEHRAAVSRARQGKPTTLGRTMSDATKAKISASKKGKAVTVHTPESRAKIGDAHRGKVLSAETKQKMSETKKANHKKKSL